MIGQPANIRSLSIRAIKTSGGDMFAPEAKDRAPVLGSNCAIPNRKAGRLQFASALHTHFAVLTSDFSLGDQCGNIIFMMLHLQHCTLR